MNNPTDDVETLHKFGYAQELARVLGGFSNFAISLSIICILAGGVTSFHVGFCSVGGAAIGLGWPLAGLFSLCVAATMGQIASAFPTAGGLYHWAALLGGRGWGWATAWFNLTGLVAVLAAINVGMFRFAMGAFAPDMKPSEELQFVAVALIAISHAIFNHLGMRVTKFLLDFSGYWILAISLAITLALFWAAPSHDYSRLVEFTNFSGIPEGDEPVWPRTDSLAWLFALGLLLPAYTITGFDASAHVSEETAHATHNVPQGIVRSVWISALMGWLMLSAAVLAMRDPGETARKGDAAFVFTMADVLPQKLTFLFYCGIAVAQYLCGLATVTSASRMAFAFARDGGLPFSNRVRYVSPRFQTPPVAIWLVAIGSILFTAYAEAYATIAAAATVLLYVSYVLPTALGAYSYGKTWTEMGPWTLGRYFRPLAIISVVGCIGLMIIGMQPPNEKALYVVAGVAIAIAIGWVAAARAHFPGPPVGPISRERRAGIARTEKAVPHSEIAPP